MSKRIDQNLSNFYLPPLLLELEVTENILLENDQRTVSVLNNIREMGVSIAFDDFGTGYASLNHLKQFPLNRIKIDRSFVRDLTTSQDDATIVRAIVSLSKLLGMTVIAEGIETESHLNLLEKFGCTEIQGYYFGRPMQSTDFTRQRTYKFLHKNS